MHTVHLFNPAAGAGRRFAAVRAQAEKTGEKIYVTEDSGHAERLCASLCRDDPHIHIIVYGGDGTVHEAVNGIMASGHGDTASFTVVPSGSGNDFSACVNGCAGFAPGFHKLDLVRVTDPDGNCRHFANSLNMGFDCDVVREADSLKHKRGLSGSTAYIAGVIRVLARKKPVPLSLHPLRLQTVRRGYRRGRTRHAPGGRSALRLCQRSVLRRRLQGRTPL